jgi:hypothetical protein
MTSHRRRYAINGGNDPPPTSWDSRWGAEFVHDSLRFSCSGSISRHYANRRTWKACPIECMKILCNIYKNGFRHVTRRVKLTETFNWESLFISSRQLLKHELVYRSEPAWERKEGEAVTKQQPPRASDCEGCEVRDRGTCGGSGVHLCRDMWFEVTAYMSVCECTPCYLSWFRSYMRNTGSSCADTHNGSTYIKQTTSAGKAFFIARA